MSSKEFAEYCMELLEPTGGCSLKRMFGGYGIFRGGVMFALIADDVLYFKVGPSNLSDYEDAGSEPFTYTGKNKPIQMSYWTVPEDVMEDPMDMREWALKANDVALKAKKK